MQGKPEHLILAKLQIIYHANVGPLPYCLILFFDLLRSPLVLGSWCITHAKKEEVARVVHKISSEHHTHAR